MLKFLWRLLINLPAFFGHLYRALPGVSRASITIDGKRIQVLRGIALLSGWQHLIAEVKADRLRQEKQELARRQSYYFGVEI